MGVQPEGMDLQSEYSDEEFEDDFEDDDEPDSETPSGAPSSKPSPASSKPFVAEDDIKVSQNNWTGGPKHNLPEGDCCAHS